MNILTNDFVKPEGQREIARFGLARNRTFKNDFVKPKDQRELAHFGLARNRTFKNDIIKPKDQRELAHLGLTRNRTFKNDIIKQVSTICSYNEPDTGLLQPDLSEQLLSVPSPPAQMTQTGFVASA